jgi:hypothetical protein
MLRECSESRVTELCWPQGRGMSWLY